MKIKVFLDTCVLKSSIVSLTRFVPRGERPSLNGKGKGSPIYRIADICPHDKIKDKGLYKEIKLLSQIATLAKEQKIELLTQFEAILELWGLPDTFGRRRTYFDEVEIKKVGAPIEYSRVFAFPNIGPKNSQFNFLESINDERFAELRRATGAYQGENSLNRNQLLDAFHIWCAEYNNCDFYLTLDFKLIKHLNNQKKYTIKTRIVRPSELLSLIFQNSIGT